MQRAKKGQGKSIRRLALTFILKQNTSLCFALPLSLYREYRLRQTRRLAELSGLCVIGKKWAFGKNCQLAKKIGRALQTGEPAHNQPAPAANHTPQ
jgi:hypothetical protein